MDKMHNSNCENIGEYICPEGIFVCCTITGEIIQENCQMCVGCKTHTHILDLMLKG